MRIALEDIDRHTAKLEQTGESIRPPGPRHRGYARRLAISDPLNYIG